MERDYDWRPINGGRGDEGRVRTVRTYCSASTFYTRAAGDSTVATQFQSEGGEGKVKGRGRGCRRRIRLAYDTLHRRDELRHAFSSSRHWQDLSGRGLGAGAWVDLRTWMMGVR